MCAISTTSARPSAHLARPVRLCEPLDSTKPIRLTKIDQLYRPWHCFLDREDECYCAGEYTPGTSYRFGSTNSFISNFKKAMDRQDRAEWRYKRQAIREAGALLAGVLNRAWLERAVLVPMPPSKAKDDPLYDDRMPQTLTELARIAGARLDVRELLLQVRSTRSSSRSGGLRLEIREIRAVYQVDESLAEPPPQEIGLFDDLLTTGAHFRVGKDLLQARFPGIRVAGIFIARCIH